MRRWRAGICLLAMAAAIGCEEAPPPGLADVETDTGAIPKSPTPTGSTVPTGAPLAPPTTTPADADHLELLRSAAKRDTSSTSAQMRLAKHCVKLSRWKEATTAVDATLALDPDHTEAKRLKRYLPKLQSAATVAQRRELEMEMTGESLAELGKRLEGAGAKDAVNARLAARQNELRERFGITDDMLRAQEPRAADAVRLSQALEAIATLTDKEVHVRKALDAEPARLDAWEKLLDVLIAQRRYDVATREVAVARRAAPGDLVLRVYEHHLGALTSAKNEEREKAIVRMLSMDRLMLVTMIADAKVGKLTR